MGTHLQTVRRLQCAVANYSVFVASLANPEHKSGFAKGVCLRFAFLVTKKCKSQIGDSPRDVSLSRPKCQSLVVFERWAGCDIAGNSANPHASLWARSASDSRFCLPLNSPHIVEKRCYFYMLKPRLIDCVNLVVKIDLGTAPCSHRRAGRGACARCNRCGSSFFFLLYLFVPVEEAQTYTLQALAQSRG